MKRPTDRADAGRRAALIGRSAALALALYVAGTGPAFAYLDPGSAYIVLQLFGAIGAGILLMFRRVRRLFTNAWARLTRRSGDLGRAGEPDRPGL